MSSTDTRPDGDDVVGRGGGGGGKGGQTAATLVVDGGAPAAGTEIPFDQYVFPFENAVFEAGPSNVLAYVGAVRVSPSGPLTLRRSRNV